MHEAATAAWLVETLRSRDPRRPGVPELEQRARELLSGDTIGIRGPQPAAIIAAAPGPAGGGEEMLGHLVRRHTEGFLSTIRIRGAFRLSKLF